MPVLCFGPVCIPLNLLLPFLLGIAHHYGLLRWLKQEWLTLRHWRQQFGGCAGWQPRPSTACSSCHGGPPLPCPAVGAGQSNQQHPEQQAAMRPRLAARSSSALCAKG